MSHPLPVYRVAVQIDGNWHPIATAHARLWAADIALALVRDGQYPAAQVWEDDRSVVTYGKEA